MEVHHMGIDAEVRNTPEHGFAVVEELRRRIYVLRDTNNRAGAYSRRKRVGKRTELDEDPCEVRVKTFSHGLVGRGKRALQQRISNGARAVVPRCVHRSRPEADRAHKPGFVTVIEPTRPAVANATEQVAPVPPPPGAGYGARRGNRGNCNVCSWNRAP